MIKSIGTSIESSSVTTHNAVVPSGIQSGDLLILITAFANPTTISSISGWTNLGEAEDDLSRVAQSVFYKVATGSEINFTYTTSGSTISNTLIARIDRRDGLPVIAQANDRSASVDPPALNTGFVASYILYIVACSIDGNRDILVYPTGYIYNQTKLVGNNLVLGLAASLTKNSNENPTQFIIDGTESYVVATIGIRVNPLKVLIRR